MKIREVTIQKGDRMYFCDPEYNGYWEVVSLRPFRVACHANGGVRILDNDSPSLWIEDIKRFKVSLKGDKQ